MTTKAADTAATRVEKVAVAEAKRIIRHAIDHGQNLRVALACAAAKPAPTWPDLTEIVAEAEAITRKAAP